MNTLEAIAKRVSVRAYKSEQIPEESLQTILKAGMSAPVGSGAYDSLHITVIQDMNLLNEIGEAVNEFIFEKLGRRMNKNFGAPTMIVVSSVPSHFPGMEFANAATVLENMAIVATDIGIDNIVWAAATAVLEQNEELQKKLAIPDSYKPTLCASFGYATEKEAPKNHTISVNRV